MNHEAEVLFEVLPGKGGDIGLITLNRPKALNSLTLNMIHSLFAALYAWQQDDTIKAVVIRAIPGRAFCAGGDLRFTYEKMLHGGDVSEFFDYEYNLNRLIFNYAKPYIAFLDGITMGGGVGISIHGSHRVGTGNLLFAMPETGIGFFPDVGGTYFLPRLPGKLGYYLGLTGARIKIDDALALNIVTHQVNSADLNGLLDTIVMTPFTADAKLSVSNIIKDASEKGSASSLLEQQEEISQCFNATTIEEIHANLERSTNKLCQEAASMLLRHSPTSLKVSLQAFHYGEQLDFEWCMNQEQILTSHFGINHDFKEGIRAVIIDKDQTPHWQPETFSGVTSEVVNKYFVPLAK